MSSRTDRLARSGARNTSLVALASLTIAVVTSGCVPDDDATDDGIVETAHLRITTTTDNPICAGTAPFLESEVLRIAEALELPLWAEDDKLDVRFGEDSVAEVCADSEYEHLNGCLRRTGSDFVVASIEVAYTSSHELVHAVRAKNGLWSATMFEEGLAEVASGSNGFPVYVRYPHGEPSVGPVELLGIPRSEFEPVYYIPSESFISWLWETYGQSTLMAFMNDRALSNTDSILSHFEDHFGQTLAEADQAWAIDERPDPSWGAPCVPERTYSLADGPLELSGDFDCREPTVYGAAYFMSLWPMCLDVTDNTRVAISFEAEHGELQVLGREPCDAGPAGAEAYRDKWVKAGNMLEEDIAGCRYRMLVSSQEPGFPATPYTIRIEEIDP